jgi:hypothetical protein
LTIVVTNLIAFRTATTNYVVMLPALILVLAALEERWGKAGGWAGAVTLLVLGVGLWVLFLATVVGNQENRLMYFPLPVMTLIGLLTIRRWKTRSYASVGPNGFGAVD